MGGKTWTYTYNADGMRTKRVSGNTSYTYYYNGDMLRYLDYDSNTTDSSQAAKLYFVLDASGNPIEVSYRPEGSTTTKFYYYIQNLQGDVVRIVNAAGKTVVSYVYNAWGKLLSADTTSVTNAANVANKNPLRYRGYYYDTDPQLYYLQSRYYDPNLGRFLNADAFASTGQGLLGNNMFAYCNNNPVILADPYGDFGLFTLANAVIGAVVGAATQIATNVLTKSDNVFAGVVGAAVGGAVYNVVAITTGSLVAASAAGSAAEALTNEAGSYISGEKELTSDNLMSSAANVVCRTAENTVTAAFTGKIASGIVKTNSGWFQPKKLISSFTGKYAQKIWGQTATQGAITAAYNIIKAGLKSLDRREE